ncbi:GNAT family N-acetyltransferase [Nocardia sp. R7R-8]|uniref:GNAT family N-acetyltransferase n=1 Tax=Nocardia sp. R7R-8 TaxID=3459304 RepID=UPI00403E2A82
MDVESCSALGPGVGPPERIELEDLLLRRWLSQDVRPRLEAINASFDEIHPWMDWLAEPATLEGQRAFGRETDESWPSAAGSFNFGIFDAGGSVLGGIGLHDRLGSRAVEIGYWCHTAHRGRGVITRSAAALTRIALTLPGVDRVEIHCDEANIRSAAVARRLGYRLDRIEPRDKCAPAESGRGMYWIKER